MDELGLKCPKCHCKLVPQEGRTVYYTRQGVRSIVRRRVCYHCGQRFSTTERVTGEGDDFPVSDPASSTSGTI